jgi:hypothetical protein
MKNLFIVLFILLLPGTGLAQKKYYVKPDGVSGLGTSWGLASNNLQAMIDKASAGDIVYVAVGTYSGGFVMKDGVSVLGGYTANKDNPTERYSVMETDDPAKQSILDGGGVQRVIIQYFPFTIPTTWKGFVIQNGNPSHEFKKGSIIYSATGDNKIIAILYKFDPETKTGMMIGVEETQKQWGGYEMDLHGLDIQDNLEKAKNDLSGQENTEKIRDGLADQSPDFSREDYSPNGNYAAYWCDTLTVGGYTDWHLPSAGEMQEVYNAGIKSVMNSLGKNLKYGYWTSSHIGNALAWAYYFGNGTFHPSLKYITHFIGAVCPFSVPSQPSSIYFAGGGVLLNENGILKNCIVKNNTSPSKGGGIYVGKGGIVDNCQVEGNEAPEGKEIYYEIPTLISPVDVKPVRFYPNPVRGGEQITISIDRPMNNAPITYQLINTSGLLIAKGELKVDNLSFPAPYQKGIYILLLQTENKNCQFKIIIN